MCRHPLVTGGDPLGMCTNLHGSRGHLHAAAPERVDRVAILAGSFDEEKTGAVPAPPDGRAPADVARPAERLKRGVRRRGPS